MKRGCYWGSSPRTRAGLSAMQKNKKDLLYKDLLPYRFKKDVKKPAISSYRIWG